MLDKCVLTLRHESQVWGLFSLEGLAINDLGMGNSVVRLI